MLSDSALDEAGLTLFVDLAGSDAALSASILRFANARMLERAVPVATIREAVSRIGIRAARVVALSHLLVSSEEGMRESVDSLDTVWKRGLARSIAARAIATVVEPRRTAEAAQAAVLADYALIAMARIDSSLFEHVMHSDEKGQRSLIGVSVPEASSTLLRQWRFPRRLCAAIAAVNGSTNESTNEAGKLPAVMGMAERISGHLISGNAAEIEAILESLGMQEDPRRVLVSRLIEEWEHRSAVLDVIPGPGSAAEVRRLTREGLAEISLATQLENRLMKRKQDELLRRVTTDALTGVKNRLAFDERLEEEFERAQRLGKPMALFLCDLDHFKSFNDEYGHQAGDLMLRAAAESMAHAARRVDMVARYGGEEFAVIAPQCGHEGARVLAERLRRAVEELTIEWRGTVLRTTVSVGGVVTMGQGAGRSPSELISAADKLLYTAKAAGRNHCVVEAVTAIEPTQSH